MITCITRDGLFLRILYKFITRTYTWCTHMASLGWGLEAGPWYSNSIGPCWSMKCHEMPAISSGLNFPWTFPSVPQSSTPTGGLVAFQRSIFLDRGLDDYDPLQLREPPLLRLQWPVLAHPAEIGPNRPGGIRRRALAARPVEGSFEKAKDDLKNMCRILMALWIIIDEQCLIPWMLVPFCGFAF